MKRYAVLGGLHVLVGLLLSRYAGLSYYAAITFLLYAIIRIIARRNAGNEAAYWTAYMAGFEILMRMTGAYPIWEAGKYSVTLLLLAGMMAERIPRPLPYPMLLYGFLLLPSFTVINYPDFFEFRTSVSFNLSGPLCLLVATLYFYKRAVPLDEFFGILRIMVFPLISMLFYLMIVTPDLSEIEYGTQSNFTATAGFGPNQVATVIGVGIFITGLLLYHNRRVTGFLLSDIALLMLLAIRGLITFSRAAWWVGWWHCSSCLR